MRNDQKTKAEARVIAAVLECSRIHCTPDFFECPNGNRCEACIEHSKAVQALQVLQPLDEFTKAYIVAALWSSTDDTNRDSGGEPLDDNYDLDDIEPQTLSQMIADCRQFQTANAELINDDNVAVTSPDYGCDARAGHDFLLTRNHHGCGFWDGDWTEPAATELTEASKQAGEYNLTASGDGGQVYGM